MNFILWLAVLGMVLLTLALTSSWLRWLPVTTSAVCLLLGVAIGPKGLGLLQLDLKDAAFWLEHLSEVAVLFSLFVGGLKLRLALKKRAWRIAFALAGPVMLLTIGGLCLLLHYGLALPWGAAMLIGAILAPTDPVLASLVQVNDAKDYDRVRFGLSGEAGLNDGVAFPFVILGLMLLRHESADSGWLGDWVLGDLLWAVPAGLLIGYWMGRGLGRLTLSLRIRNDDSTSSPNDYLSLALIALAYVAAEAINGYGFLSVFAAGLGLRQAEVTLTGAHTPSEHLVQPVVGHQHVEPEHAIHGDRHRLEDSQVAAGIMMGDMLAFGSIVERAMEVFLVTLLGVALLDHWDWRALPVALALFLLIRPLSVLAMPWGSLLDRRQRLLVGWFGIRGIGSLFYLFYALNHGLEPGIASLCTGFTLSVLALSILLHGVSTQPLLVGYERYKGKNLNP